LLYLRHTMKTTRLIALLLAAPLAACTVGGGDDTVPPGDDTVPPSGNDIAGAIAADVTLSGTVHLTDDATVNPGVTLTLSAGTVFEAATGKTLRVQGNLVISGALGQEVMMMPASGTWAGIVAEAGSNVNIAYVQGGMVSNFVYSKATSVVTIDHVILTGVGKASQVEGLVTITKSSFEGSSGVNVLTTGSLDASDTYFLGTAGDTLVQTGGTMTLDHIDVGNTSTTGDHCAFHINAGSAIAVSYSNITDTSVGLMIGGTTGANFMYNNFDNIMNLEDISSGVLNSGGVFDHNYITGTPTTIQGITITNPEAIAVATAGPRP